MPPPLDRLPQDLAKRLEKIERAAQQAAKAARHAAGKAAKAAQLKQMEHDAGGDLVLGRVRSGRGAKIGARYDFDSVGNPEVKAIGPVPLLANPIPEHEILPKKGQALVIGGDFYASASHPGTPGKDTWNKGREEAKREVSKIVDATISPAIRRAFKEG